MDPKFIRYNTKSQSMEQGNLSVVPCYGKMKKLWEELNVLQLVPQCSCEAIKNCKCDTSGNITNIISSNFLLD